MEEVNDDDEWGEADEEVIVLSANPMDFVQTGVARGTHGLERASRRSDLLVASLANLAISYNVVNAGLAIKIIQKAGLHSISGADESLINSGAVLGMIAGQVFFGVVGDNTDRNRALTYSLLLCFIGAAACALSVDIGWGLDIQSQLIWWRIILGVGAGGVYPLAAALARASGVDWAWLRKQRARIHGEGSPAAKDHDTGSTAVAFMFSMQGVGHLAAYVVGWILLAAFPDRPVLTWRLHLGVGAVPPLIVVLMQATYGNARYVALEQPAHGSRAGAAAAGGSVGVAGTAGAGAHRAEEDTGILGHLHVLRNRLFGPDQFWVKFIGTAGSWFFFDVTFYGNQLYQEDVLVSVFGEHSTVTDVARQDSIVALVALPGYFISIVCIDWLGPRFVQLQGFVGMALTFGVIGLSFDSLVRGHDYVLMLLYSLTFLFSNFGPNSTTFMLPALTFPDEVRTTLNGASAAAGKLGAVAGSLLFVPASRVYGVAEVLLMCAGVSLAGWLLTLAFVQPGSRKAGSRNGAPSGEGGGVTSGAMAPLEAIVGMNGRGSKGSGRTAVTPQERLPFAQRIAEATRNGTYTAEREMSTMKGGARSGSQDVLKGDGSDRGLGQAFGGDAGDSTGYAAVVLPYGRGRDVEGAAEVPSAGGDYSLEDDDEEYDGAAGSRSPRLESGAPARTLV